MVIFVRCVPSVPRRAVPWLQSRRRAPGPCWDRAPAHPIPVPYPRGAAWGCTHLRGSLEAGHPWMCFCGGCFEQGRLLITVSVHIFFQVRNCPDMVGRSACTCVVKINGVKSPGSLVTVLYGEFRLLIQFGLLPKCPLINLE